jgi:hypothetical protein
VLAAARERDAGVLFLGDFWHARGALPVAPLNAVLALFSRWDVPTVMIPGNHDQVTAGGEEHALTPLGAASPRVHIFSRPAVWRNALWLPYRRDESLLRAAMAAARTPGAQPLRAVFAHADVLGASLNEAHQARHGMAPDAFPPRTPVYTGHYHTPHTVPGTAITYVGAPYQVSLSEAGQAKRLMLLDSDWAPIGEIPLDVGPRHFTLSGGDAAPPPGLRAGDRLRWTLAPAAAGATPAPAPAAAALLEAAGVTVELVRPPAAPPPRIVAAEALGPAALLDAYADAVGLRPAARALASQILAGLSGASGGPARRAAALELHALEVEGYGPFRGCVRYPLDSRGLVVVSGRNADDAQMADSNGAGKTTLVMAPLWALTGDADCGGGGGGGRLTAAQVVADGAKEARVRLEGLLNGQPFWLERATSKKSLKHLRWGTEGIDRTMADARLTQAALDEALDTPLLAMTAFHGQHSIEKLLDANDGELKAALGRVVSLSIWEAARDASFAALRASKEMAQNQAAAASALAPVLATTRANAAEQEAAAAAWEAARAARAAQAEAAVDAARSAARADATPLHDALAKLRRAYADASAAAAAAKAAAKEAADSVAAALAADEAAISAAPGRPEDDAAAAAFAAAEAAETESRAAETFALRSRDAVAAADYAAQAAVAAVASFRGVAAPAALVAAGGAKGSVAPGGALGVCDRCTQPIDAAHFASHVAELEATASAAAAKLAAASAADAAAAAALTATRAKAAAASREAMRAEAAAGAAAEAARGAAAARRSAAETAAARAGIEAARLEGSVNAALATGRSAKDAEEKLAAVLGEAGPKPAEAVPPAPGAAALAPAAAAAALDAAAAEAAAAEPRVRDAAAAVERADAAAAAVAAERGSAGAAAAQLRASEADIASRLAAAEAASAEAEARAGVLAEVDAAFNKGGIQSYLFDGVLAELESRAGELLRELTAGALTLTLRSAPSANVVAAAERRKRVTAKKSAKAAAAAAESNDEAVAASSPSTPELAPSREAVCKRVWARGADGVPLERGLRQLSGGERRRVALALSLAFADLAAERGGVRCSLLVLDEALQHLDNEGVGRVAAMLRTGSRASTILLTSQAMGRALSFADRVDHVVKEEAASRVEVQN